MGLTLTYSPTHRKTEQAYGFDAVFVRVFVRDGFRQRGLMDRARLPRRLGIVIVRMPLVAVTVAALGRGRR
jgi:hypothetical protein